MLSLPSSLHAKDGISLFLIADQDFTPASNGQSADKRSLGVMLMEGSLSVDASKKAEPLLEPEG